MHIGAGVVAAALALATPHRSFAEEMPVPVDLQAALFKKIFDYDRTLKNRGEIVVMVIHEGAESKVSQDLVKAFQEAGVVSRSIAAAELGQNLADVAVVYVTPGVNPASVSELCASHSILSISGVPDLALRGEVAIGIGISDQKPQVLVHLRRVKTEGHELASGLLEVATVIR